jgi:hypothetical protein
MPRYDTPIFYMPRSMDHTYKRKKTGLKNFLKFCFKLLNDKNSMDLFKSVLEKYSIEEGAGTEPKKVNHVMLSPNVGSLPLNWGILY